MSRSSCEDGFVVASSLVTRAVVKTTLLQLCHYYCMYIIYCLSCICSHPSRWYFAIF